LSEREGYLLKIKDGGYKPVMVTNFLREASLFLLVREGRISVKDKKGDTNRLWDALSLLPPSIHTR
jgi:hypothetical protein